MSEPVTKNNVFLISRQDLDEVRVWPYGIVGSIDVGRAVWLGDGLYRVTGAKDNKINVEPIG